MRRCICLLRSNISWKVRLLLQLRWGFRFVFTQLDWFMRKLAECLKFMSLPQLILSESFHTRTFRTRRIKVNIFLLVKLRLHSWKMGFVNDLNGVSLKEELLKIFCRIREKMLLRRSLRQWLLGRMYHHCSQMWWIVCRLKIWNWKSLFTCI